MAPPVKRPAAAAKAAAAAVPNKKKPAGGGGKRQPPKTRLPEGTELVDLKKQAWRVGRVIGEGGFGLVYLGTGGGPDATIDCVIKAEPKGNGPLFCEMHFYQRAADGTKVGDWASARRLDYVGVPRFYGCGHVAHSGQEHRFLAIERLGEDLERQFEQQRDALGRVPARRAFAVAVRVLDALEFVHDSGYAHADVKASNVLTSGQDRVYLADFGLAFRYFADGRWLKEEKEDPKRRHDGTSEFCSRDAHRGLAPTPRADIENLGWCLLAWLTGELPWQPFRDDHERVQRAKEGAMDDLAGFLGGRRFARGSADADAVAEVLQHADHLGYHERPQYARLRDLMRRRADAPDLAGTAASSGNGVAMATAKKTAAVSKPRPGSVAKKSPRSTAVAKASPRSRAVAKASPRSRTVAKESPRSTAAAKALSPTSMIAADVKSPPVARASPGAATVDTSAAASNGGEASSSRKRKSGCCQTSPHLLKEAKRLARAARK